MAPGSHLLASWLIANRFTHSQRERRVVTLAGVAPDLDGMGWLINKANTFFGSSGDYYFQYHHVLAHNLLAAIVLSAIACSLASSRRLLVFGLSFVAVHLHFLCDVLGSRGPDGYQWPIFYFAPFYPAHEWVWSGEWELDAWQNILITLCMLAIALVWSWKQRYSFIQVISARLDRAFFDMLARYGRG